MLEGITKVMTASGIVCLAVVTSACGTSPVSPSSTVSGASPATVPLTIAARDARSGAFLPAIRAYASNLRSCTTKDDGRCVIEVDNGAVVTVAVWGEGYADALRTSTVSGASRWTFYLGGK